MTDNDSDIGPDIGGKKSSSNNHDITGESEENQPIECPICNDYRNDSWKSVRSHALSKHSVNFSQEELETGDIPKSKKSISPEGGLEGEPETKEEVEKKEGSSRLSAGRSQSTAQGRSKREDIYRYPSWKREYIRGMKEIVEQYGPKKHWWGDVKDEIEGLDRGEFLSEAFLRDACGAKGSGVPGSWAASRIISKHESLVESIQRKLSDSRRGRSERSRRGLGGGNDRDGMGAQTQPSVTELVSALSQLDDLRSNNSGESKVRELEKKLDREREERHKAEKEALKEKFDILEKKMELIKENQGGGDSELRVIPRDTSNKIEKKIDQFLQVRMAEEGFSPDILKGRQEIPDREMTEEQEQQVYGEVVERVDDEFVAD